MKTQFSVYDQFPEIRLDAKKSYLFVRVRKPEHLPEGKVIAEKDGLYLIEKER